MSSVKGTKLTLNVPPELEGMEHDLERAFGAAIYKLARNTKKGKWEDLDINKCFGLLRGEVDELEEAISEGNTIDAIMEAADIINFAIICTSISIRDGKNGA